MTGEGTMSGEEAIETHDMAMAEQAQRNIKTHDTTHPDIATDRAWEETEPTLAADDEGKGVEKLEGDQAA